MKVLVAGRLTDKVDECLEYHLASEFIDCLTIGQESAEEHDDLLKRIPEASVRG